MANIKAVAMDMNASYDILVKEKLPQAQIVYDRYHMQAQYGKEVLGVVRLNEARKHKAISKELTAQLPDQSAESKREIKKQIQAEKLQYSKIKKLRWALLTNGEKLTDNQYSDMQSILEKHSSLAVCYAMKEDMVSGMTTISSCLSGLFLYPPEIREEPKNSPGKNRGCLLFIRKLPLMCVR